ncbi:hypothetical protein ACFLU5_04210 [Bacteroidota bacterium]
MNTIESKLILTVIFILLMILSGIWLTRKGQPYSKLVLTFHKLLTLLAIIFSIIIINHIKDGILGNIMNFSIIIAGGIFYVTGLVSGGILSRESPDNRKALLLHRISAVIVIVFSIVLYFKLA